MEKYEMLEMEVIAFDADDIIVTSGGTMGPEIPAGVVNIGE